MCKFYHIDKGRFSACLSKTYAKVCMILVDILSLFSVISCMRQIEMSFISYQTSLEKVKKGKIKL